MGESNLEMDARLFGHSHAAHKLFGWCANCKDRTARQELSAWRQWAFTRFAGEPDQQQPASTT